MQIFIAALIGALVQAAGSLVGRVLLSLGIGYATYSGIDLSISWVRDQAIANIGALPANAILVLGAAKVGTCISILTSALLVRLTLSGLTSGTLKKFTVK
jgi:hypothetical protein